MKKLATLFKDYSNSVPLVLKWSVSIACFVSLVMGGLGWYLIAKQTHSFHQQNEFLGQVVADQLARAASEPLLAGDDLRLQMLVSQQEKNALIFSMEIYDIDGQLHASAGVPFETDIKQIITHSENQQSDWSADDVHTMLFSSPIIFKNLTAGIAVVRIDRRPLEQHLETLTRALLTTTIGLILAGIFLAFPLAFRLFKPIDELVKVGAALNSGASRGSCKSETRSDEIGKILSSFHQMAEDIEKKNQAEVAFSRHLSPSIANEILNSPGGGALGGTLSEGSVLFCDIVGFTELSEDMNPEDVGGLLNQYFSYFSVAAQSCHGAVDKFIGDCIMIVFGVPDTDEVHGLHALTCALLIQEIATRINQRRELEGHPIVKFRLGVNSGTMLAGNLGSDERMQYTVVGDTVNLASRMCSICEPGEIMATEQVFNHPSVSAVVKSAPMAAVQVKGRRQAVTPYCVTLGDINDMGRIRRELERILPSIE